MGLCNWHCLYFKWYLLGYQANQQRGSQALRYSEAGKEDLWGVLVNLAQARRIMVLFVV